MSAAPSSLLSQGPSSSTVALAHEDASCRAPLLLLFTSAIVWLILGTLCAFFASIKLHAPGMLAGAAWLTVGRLEPAAMNAILYGFATQAALGVVIWIFCRLGRVPLLNSAVTFIAGAGWNLMLTLGFLGILKGGSTGFRWLEMPGFIWPLLLLAYALIAMWALITFHFRLERTLYVSQWYFVAALFWFPWLYSAANILLLQHPVRGVMQAVVNAWYTNGVLELWLGAVGIGVIYYFIPKLLDRPLYSRQLAAFGFWTFAFFAGWRALAPLAAGPIPNWMGSVSIASSGLMIVPIVAVAANWHLTIEGLRDRIRDNLPLRFIVFAALAYQLASIENILLSFRSVNELTGFTFVPQARIQFTILGFAGMALFGALYYIVPRLTRIEWPNPKWAGLHFWCSAGGVGLYFVALTIGGLIQGFRMNLGTADMVDVNKTLIPFIGLSTLGWLIWLAGQILFLANLCQLLRRYFEPLRTSAVVFARSTGILKTEAKP